MYVESKPSPSARNSTIDSYAVIACDSFFGTSTVIQYVVFIYQSVCVNCVCDLFFFLFPFSMRKQMLLMFKFFYWAN
ncbi:hypothetical protein NC651_002251 [Populus alba x Populus x berolinensis]|nr:hypothetical protein NC651_002251 [Populus alba x Populus x berolinensis]